MYLIDLYKDEYDDLISLKRKNILQEYAEKNNFNFENINTFLNHYEDIFDIIGGSKIVKKHNNEFKLLFGISEVFIKELNFSKLFCSIN